MHLTTYVFECMFAEFRDLEEGVRIELAASINVLRQFGPTLGRPHVDVLHTSKHKNMKELRLKAADGVWRFAFAFDPNRQAILFCGGDKSTEDSDTFYRELIKKADQRFDEHLKGIRQKEIEAERLKSKQKRR
jgi:hypothetical protein